MLSENVRAVNKMKDYTFIHALFLTLVGVVWRKVHEVTSESI